MIKILNALYIPTTNSELTATSKFCFLKLTAAYKENTMTKCILPIHPIYYITSTMNETVANTQSSERAKKQLNNQIPYQEFDSYT